MISKAKRLIKYFVFFLSCSFMFSCGLINQVENFIAGVNENLDKLTRLTPDQIELSGLVIDPPVEGALISLRNITNADDFIPITGGVTNTRSNGSFSIVFSTNSLGMNASSYYEVVATGGTDTVTKESLAGLSLSLPVEIGELVTNRGTGRRVDLAVTPITSLLTAEIFTNLKTNAARPPRLADIKKRVSDLLDFGSSDADIESLFGNPLMNTNVLKTSLYLGKLANLAPNNKKPDSFKNLLEVLERSKDMIRLSPVRGNGAGLENFLANDANFGNFRTTLGITNDVKDFRDDFNVYKRAVGDSSINFSSSEGAKKFSKRIFQTRIGVNFLPFLTNAMVVKEYKRTNETEAERANVVKLNNGIRLVSEAIGRAAESFTPPDMRTLIEGPGRNGDIPPDPSGPDLPGGVPSSFTNDGVPGLPIGIPGLPDNIDLANPDDLDELLMNLPGSPLDNAASFTASNLVFIGNTENSRDQRINTLVVLLRELRAFLRIVGGIELAGEGEEDIAGKVIPDSTSSGG